MTKDNSEIPLDVFYQLTMVCDKEFLVPGGYTYEHIQNKIKLASRVFAKFGKSYPVLCGKTLFSLLLPDDLMYTSKNKALTDEPVLKVYKGIVYEGAVNKANLKGSHNSLICVCLLYTSPSPRDS